MRIGRTSIPASGPGSEMQSMTNNGIVRTVSFITIESRRYLAGQPAAAVMVDGVLEWYTLDQLRRDVSIFGPRLGFVMGIGFYLLANEGAL